MFKASDEDRDGFGDVKTVVAAHAPDVALVVQPSVMTGNGESSAGNLTGFVGSPSCAKDGVLSFGAAFTLPAQILLKLVTVFSQIVQQPGETGFLACAERSSKAGS